MTHIKIILILFAIIVLHSNAYSQNLYGIKKFAFEIYYSDIAEKYKRILPDENKIVSKIVTNISDLEYIQSSYLLNFKGGAKIWVYYNINKNTEETYNHQYYGNIDLYVIRLLKDEEFDILIAATVFYKTVSIVMNNPTSELIKTDFNQHLTYLITALKAEYYQDN